VYRLGCPPKESSQLGFAVVPAVVAVGASLLNQKNAIRAKQLAKDLAEAQSQPLNPAHQDYLAYRASHGDNVTRYEYDNLRRPLENQPDSVKQASGLFPVSHAMLPIVSAASQFIGPLEPSAAGALGPIAGLPPWVPIAAGVAALALFALTMSKSKRGR
jgi:hypothetical protein